MTQASSPNPPITKIDEGLYLGDGVASRQKAILEEHNITAVVSLSIGRWVHWSQPWYKEIVPEGNHLFIACNDSMTQDLLPQLAGICDFIECHRAPGTGSILVHCDRGRLRSVTAMIAYLMRSSGLPFSEALALVKGKTRVKPNENFIEQLEVWEAVGYDIWSDAEKRVPKAEYAAYLAKRAERLEERGLTGNEPVGIQSL